MIVEMHNCYLNLWFLVFCTHFLSFIKNFIPPVTWISPDYFESLLLPQLLRAENDAKQSDEIQVIPPGPYFNLVFKTWR